MGFRWSTFCATAAGAGLSNAKNDTTPHPAAMQNAITTTMRICYLPLTVVPGLAARNPLANPPTGRCLGLSCGLGRAVEMAHEIGIAAPDLGPLLGRHVLDAQIGEVGLL
jgi:hypothetical protein